MAAGVDSSAERNVADPAPKELPRKAVSAGSDLALKVPGKGRWPRSAARDDGPGGKAAPARKAGAVAKARAAR